MEEFGNNEKGKDRDEVFSKSVRAGKRTYFFDVKTTRGEELYLTITESKRRFNNETNKFFYEKHKIFLYKEDFEKFNEGLAQVIHFIHTGEKPIEPEQTSDNFADVNFDDLGQNPTEE
ncbi:MAG: DUF3276 family protein [Bacteroidales bacterium]|nr:DUF3276 family protein [Bacteroidales bacterium]